MPPTTRELNEVRKVLGLDRTTSVPPPDYQVLLAKRLLANLHLCNRDADGLAMEIGQQCGGDTAARWAIYDLIVDGQVAISIERRPFMIPILLPRVTRPHAFKSMFADKSVRLVLNSTKVGQHDRVAIVESEEAIPDTTQPGAESVMTVDRGQPRTEKASSPPENGPFPTSDDEGLFYWKGVAVLDLEGTEWRLLNYLWNHFEPTIEDVLKGVWPTGGRKSFKSLLSLLNKKLGKKGVAVCFSCKKGKVRRLVLTQTESPSVSS